MPPTYLLYLVRDRATTSFCKSYNLTLQTRNTMALQRHVRCMELQDALVDREGVNIYQKLVTIEYEFVRTTYLFPVPTRYVFVPCSVMWLGLHPSILTILEESFSIWGINVNDIVKHPRQTAVKFSDRVFSFFYRSAATQTSPDFER